MKKLYISCPMKGRSDEKIKKSREVLHKLAELVFGEELEVIDNINPNGAPESKNEGIRCLGYSISTMAEADYFVGVEQEEFHTGCAIELTVSEKYNIPSFVVSKSFFVNADRANESFFRQKLEKLCGRKD